jgi:pimeloyl-ACP methyl ester carboxylesterase
VLGLSWGSTLALELYRRRPEIPRSLVLAAAYTGWAGSLPPEEVAERLERILEQIERPAREWVHEYIPTLLTEWAPAEIVAELGGPAGGGAPGERRSARGVRRRGADVPSNGW